MVRGVWDRHTRATVWLVCPVALTLLTMNTCVHAQTSAETIACRVLETHTDALHRLAIVTFHHRDQSEAERLGALLRTHSGVAVQFQSADSKWHEATVLRLKSCFGRGMLLFPAGTAQLAEKDEFLLRFSPPTVTSP